MLYLKNTHTPVFLSEAFAALRNARDIVSNQTIVAGLNESLVMSGRGQVCISMEDKDILSTWSLPQETGGTFDCIVYLPNTDEQGCTGGGTITFKEDDDTEEWLDYQCALGTSKYRPPGEGQYRVHAPSPGDCGIEVKTAGVADSGVWAIIEADNQATVIYTNLEGESREQI